MKKRSLSNAHNPAMTPDAAAALDTLGFSRRDFLKQSGL